MDTRTPHQLLRRKSERLYPTDKNRLLLEPPKPLSQSLEWRLAARYWLHHGVAPFSDGSVPYIINNSGWAPRAAAELILEMGRQRDGNLIVIEVAAGSGIFARQVLDYVQKKSLESNEDTYERLLWICTDGAQNSVQSWKNRGQFMGHEGHIIMKKMLASDVDTLALPTGSVIAVIANYALDSLCADVVRRDGGRLHLQACIYGDESQLIQSVGMSLADVQAQIDKPDPEALDVLLPLLDILEVQASFIPEKVQYSQDALDAAKSDVAMVNTGSLEFLEKALSKMIDGGFVLINDYGATLREEFKRQTFVHRFGGTITCALNFPHLDQWFQKKGCQVLIPIDDAHRTIHTRIAVCGGVHLEKTFQKWYCDTLYVHADRVGSWTNSYIAGGQISEAVEVFERHLRWCPTDWHKLAEAAQLLMQQLGHLDEAQELAHTACTINPWTSTLVWNVYGSVLFSKGLLEEAEKAWRKAFSIWPEDPSTWLNFSYLYASQGHNEKALECISKGLSCDHQGGFRPALLQKQSEILGQKYQIHKQYADRLTRRHRTLVDAIRPYQ
ncbi:MAG: hypothetical protein CL916_10670 [Deltaproteobacteria bacterium]|nr:hypothetical protein [Deltaproteobacteria bacterium]